METHKASMKIKSFFSNSVEQAIHQARKELGAEAVLITTRHAAPEARHLGAYEVVFGSSADAANQSSEVESSDLNREVALLRDQLESIKRVLQPSATTVATYAEPEKERIYQELVRAGLESPIAQQIVDEAVASSQEPQASGASGSENLETLTIECINRRVRFSAKSDPFEPGARRALIVVGPPGAGKTTTLAKIAIREYLSRRVSMRIISVDPYRVASHEKLRSLARIIGVGFTAASSMREFMEAVDEFRNKDVVLIDTPGFSGADFLVTRDLADFLGQLPSKEIHLVLPAWMRREDLLRCIRQYDVFQPDCLLFTKLDETESRGASLGAALESGKPLSFVSVGQSIPEDLVRATPDLFLMNLFSKGRLAATSAA